MIKYGKNNILYFMNSCITWVYKFFVGLHPHTYVHNIVSHKDTIFKLCITAALLTWQHFNYHFQLNEWLQLVVMKCYTKGSLPIMDKPSVHTYFVCVFWKEVKNLLVCPKHLDCSIINSKL